MQKITYTFKKATLRDFKPFWPVFVENIKAQFPDYSAKEKEYFLKSDNEYSPKHIKNGLKRKEVALYLAYSKGQVIGFLYTIYIYGGVGMADWLAVSKEHQGRGVATKLLKMWQKEAKSLGMHKLHIWTEKRNLEFYKKQGFTYVAEIPKNYFGSNDHLFYKALQAPKESKFLKKIKI